jgi:hypothetical protein
VQEFRTGKAVLRLHLGRKVTEDNNRRHLWADEHGPN